MLTIHHVARILHVSRDTVRRIVVRRELNAYRVGGQLRFSVRDVELYLNNVRTTETEKV